MAAQGSLQTMCRKTKFCKYYASGRCTRQQDCAFAHDFAELRALPDLSRTKLCPRLASGGQCGEVDCPFAHEKAEKRKVRLFRSWEQKAQGRRAAPAPGAHPLDMHPAEALPQAKFREALHANHSAPLDDCSSSALLSRQTTEEGCSRNVSGSSLDIITNGSNPSTFSSTDEVPPPPPSPPSVAPLAHTAPSQLVPDTRLVMEKTELCTFYLNNCCKRGAACHFAHGEKELKARPNLLRTKMCLKMQIRGICQDPACRYAHSTEELRTVDVIGQGSKTEVPQEERAAEEDGEGGSTSVEDACQQATPGWLDGLPEIRFDTGELQVKNTFLTLEEPPMMDTAISRAKSVPAMFKILEVEADDTESTTSSPKSIDIDFLSHPLEFSFSSMSPISRAETTEVPVCAIQKVDRLDEFTEGLEVVECAFKMPAPKRVYMAGGK